MTEYTVENYVEMAKYLLYHDTIDHKLDETYTNTHFPLAGKIGFKDCLILLSEYTEHIDDTDSQLFTDYCVYHTMCDFDKKERKFYVNYLKKIVNREI